MLASGGVMNETFDIYTLIFLVIAVVIFLRLRSVLGRRTGSERPPYDPYSASETNGPAKPQQGGQDNVVHLPRSSEEPVYGIQESEEEVIAEKLKGHAPENSALEKDLKDICKVDREFDPGQFLKGAKTAYEIIVMAFASGNKRTLKPLLNRDVYDSFVSAINEREERKETVDSSFVGINKATIIDAELKEAAANVTVKFVSELIMAVRNSAGEVVEGDPMKIREITDIWTFSRDIRSRDPNWKLVATETAN